MVNVFGIVVPLINRGYRPSCKFILENPDYFDEFEVWLCSQPELFQYGFKFAVIFISFGLIKIIWDIRRSII